MSPSLPACWKDPSLRPAFSVAASFRLQILLFLVLPLFCLLPSISVASLHVSVFWFCGLFFFLFHFNFLSFLVSFFPSLPSTLLFPSSSPPASLCKAQVLPLSLLCPHLQRDGRKRVIIQHEPAADSQGDRGPHGVEVGSEERGGQDTLDLCHPGSLAGSLFSS